MKETIIIVFLLFLLIQTGVLFSASAYIKGNHFREKDIKYWLSSIIFSIISLFLFAIGTKITIDSLKHNSIVFTFANTFYIASIIFQTFFIFSLSKNVSSKTVYFSLIFLVIFATQFEFLRIYGYFAVRVIEIALMHSFILTIQLILLARLFIRNHTFQIKLLFAFTVAEIILVISRLIITASETNPNIRIEELPLSLMAVVWLGLAFNSLSYLSMVGFWSERTKKKELDLINENEFTKRLVSERESLLQVLMISNKSAAAGALSATLAHELNQPIGANLINIFTLKKLLNDKSITDTQIDNVITRIIYDNKRAGDIIKTLRTIFSPAPSYKERNYLYKIVESTVSLVIGKCRACCIELQSNVSANLLVHIGHADLHLVLLNLVNNAIDALNKMPNEMAKQITISAKEQEGFVQLTVQDNGIGISEDSREHIFKLFKSQNNNGLGIGLWLSRYIMERNGGSISFVNNLSGGCQFIVNIPLLGDTF